MTKHGKNSKVALAVIVFAFLLFAVFVFTPLSGWLLGVISPGFEGAKCYCYGADFRFNSDWDGTYQLHRYQDAEDPLVYHEAWGDWDKIYWASVATPADVAIGWHTHLWPDTERAKPHLGIHIESNIQLKDMDRQGDPLGWNDTKLDSGRRIEYWSRTLVKEETEDKVIYHYTVEKESFIVAPAEFWVGFYLVPSQSDAGTGSGWREGEWQQIVVWLMLDWTVWDNAYKDPWLDDPEINVFDNPHDGAVLNKEKTWEYRGGFPIAGWIQGWEKAGWTSDFGEDEDPLWFTTRGKESKIYTIEQLADKKDILMSKVQFAPSLVGQFLSLYNEPSASFDYEGGMYQGGYSDIDYEDENNPVTTSVKTPDSRMKKTMYFPINIQNFGTYADGDWWSGWRVFYPSCYFRIRMLYGVYGDFTYLWTEELARDKTVDYPVDGERHGTTVIHTRGLGSPLIDWWNGVVNWFANPFNTFLSMIVLVLIVIVVISIASPGVWTALAMTRRKGG